MDLSQLYIINNFSNLKRLQLWSCISLSTYIVKLKWLLQACSFQTLFTVQLSYCPYHKYKHWSVSEISNSNLNFINTYSHLISIKYFILKVNELAKGSFYFFSVHIMLNTDISLTSSDQRTWWQPVHCFSIVFWLKEVRLYAYTAFAGTRLLSHWVLLTSILVGMVTEYEVFD